MKHKIVQILALVCIVVASFGLVACSSTQSNEELIRTALTEDLAELTNSENSDFAKALEGSAADSFESLGVDSTEFASSYLEGFSYEIREIVVDDEEGSAEVNLSITIKSMDEFVSEWSAQYQSYISSLETLPSEDELYQKAGGLMMDVVESLELKTTDVVISYTLNEDNEWEPNAGNITSALTSALLA